jgi:hypothetical protein
MIKLSTRGLQQAQTNNRRRIQALKPSGARGQAVQYVTSHAHQFLVRITHRDTGALAASRRMMVDYGSARGKLYTSPTARNPRSGAYTAEYDVYEEARGGDHAAWTRTEDQIRDKLLPHGIQIIREAIR